jgi:hypothetical protein
MPLESVQLAPADDVDGDGEPGIVRRRLHLDHPVDAGVGLDPRVVAQVGQDMDAVVGDGQIAGGEGALGNGVDAAGLEPPDGEPPVFVPQRLGRTVMPPESTTSWQSGDAPAMTISIA